MSNSITNFQEFALSPGQILIWWLGGASFYLRTEHNRVIVDPYLSNCVYDILKPLFRNPVEELSRITASPLKPNEIVCDYFLCTHDHLDHLDPETIKGIRNKSHIKFIGPESCARHFRELGVPANNIVIIKKGESLILDDDCHITAIPAKHRGPLEIDNSLKLNKEVYGEDDGLGYILSIDHINIYHTSDTEYLHDFEELGALNIDILLLAANGKGGNLTAEEGVNLIGLIKPKVIIPMHYGIIPYTNSDPAILKKLLVNSKIVSELKILNVGDFYLYDKGKMK